MFAIEAEGVTCGIVPRTIGGSYAVLIAEQLSASRARLIVGLTSAGRVSPELPLPCLLVVTSAIRDEGTSYHYLPAGREVECPTPVAPLLEKELRETGWTVRSGKAWTTDAPYRETTEQLAGWAGEGVLAVEMQAASLFAFGTARGAAVACVAMISNPWTMTDSSSTRARRKTACGLLKHWPARSRPSLPPEISPHGRSVNSGKPASMRCHPDPMIGRHDDCQTLTKFRRNIIMNESFIYVTDS